MRRRDEPPADRLHLYARDDTEAQAADPYHRRRLRLTDLGALADVHVGAEEGEPGLTDAVGKGALTVVELVVSDGRCAVADAVHEVDDGEAFPGFVAVVHDGVAGEEVAATEH